MFECEARWEQAMAGEWQLVFECEAWWEQAVAGERSSRAVSGGDDSPTIDPATTNCNTNRAQPHGRPQFR